MDLYTTIVGLYSQNRHEVLRVVNTAIHSKCNLSEGIEVIHTGFYCFTHTGKELEFLYDTQSQILYFQGSNSNGYHFPLGVLFQSKCLPHIINYQGSVRMRFSLMLNNNSFFCYQGYDTIQQSFINKVVLYFPITTYTYFIFQKYEGYHAIKIIFMYLESQNNQK